MGGVVGIRGSGPTRLHNQLHPLPTLLSTGGRPLTPSSLNTGGPLTLTSMSTEALLPSHPWAQVAFLHPRPWAQVASYTLVLEHRWPLTPSSLSTGGLLHPRPWAQVASYTLILEHRWPLTPSSLSTGGLLHPRSWAQVASYTLILEHRWPLTPSSSSAGCMQHNLHCWTQALIAQYSLGMLQAPSFYCTMRPSPWMQVDACPHFKHRGDKAVKIVAHRLDSHPHSWMQVASNGEYVAHIHPLTLY